MKTISSSVGRRDSSGNLSQFHYARPDRPYLVTQVFYPRESSITNLVYDHQDKLVLVKINQVAVHLHHTQRWVLFSLDRCTAFSHLLIVKVWFTFEIKNAFLQLFYIHLFGVYIV